jgi:hypothetical protein
MRRLIRMNIDKCTNPGVVPEHEKLEKLLFQITERLEGIENCVDGIAGKLFGACDNGVAREVPANVEQQIMQIRGITFAVQDKVNFILNRLA